MKKLISILPLLGLLVIVTSGCTVRERSPIAEIKVAAAADTTDESAPAPTNNLDYLENQASNPDTEVQAEYQAATEGVEEVAPAADEETQATLAEAETTTEETEDTTTDDAEPADDAAAVPAARPAPPAPKLIPVYRSMHATGAFYWTARIANVNAVYLRYQFAYQGVAFQVCDRPGADCQIPLYACYSAQYQMNYLYHQLNCGGIGIAAELLGFVRNSTSPVNTVPLTGLRHPAGWLFYTTSPAELAWFRDRGWRVIIHYFTPR